MLHTINKCHNNLRESIDAADVGAAIVHRRDGVQSQGSLHFATKESFAVGADLAISMTIRPTNGGNVGIGTLNPGNFRLAVNGRENDGSTSASVRIISGAGENQQTMLLDGNEIYGVNGLSLNNNSDQNVVLATGGGNVGIGTTDPSTSLHVQGSNNQTDVLVRDGDFARMRMVATDPDNDVTLSIQARGSDNVNRAEIGTVSNHGLVLFTNGSIDGSPSIAINASGAVCIGNC